jgi:hypothetical protein
VLAHNVFIQNQLLLNGQVGTSGNCPISGGQSAPTSWGSCGASGNATSIQGVAVSATTPTTGQGLQYNGTQYVPGTFSSSNPYSLANFGASGLPVTYGNVTSGSNSVTVLSAASWVSGEGIYIPSVSSDTSYPISGVTCDHVTVSGNTLTMLNADNSACNAGWTSSTNSVPILHYKMTSGTITSGTNSLALNSALTFAAGQGIRVAGAGAAGADLICPKITLSGTTALVFQGNGTTACNASTSVTNGAVYHDDTAAVKAAVATGNPVYAPAGTYPISSEVDLPNALKLYGDGLQDSYFIVDQNAINGFVIKSSGVVIQDLAIIASEDFTPTSGNLLLLCDGISTCFNTNITRILEYGGYDQFAVLNKAIQGSFSFATLHLPQHDAIYLDNPVPYGDINFDEVQAQSCSVSAGCGSATGIAIDAADTDAWNSVKMNGFAHNLSITANLGDVVHQRFTNTSMEGTGNAPSGGYLVDLQNLSSHAVSNNQFVGGEYEINQASAAGLFRIGSGVTSTIINGITAWGYQGTASSCVDMFGTLATFTSNDLSQCGDAIKLESSAANVTITANMLYTTAGWGINSLGGSNLQQASNVFNANTAGTQNITTTPDFSFTTTPSTLNYNPTLAATQTPTFAIAQTAIDGYTGTATYSTNSLSGGMSGSFSPTTITGTGSSTLTLSFPYSQAAATTNFNVSATDGSNTHANPTHIVVSDINQGLVAGYYMNEGSGSTFSSTPSSNDATASSVTWTTSSGFTGQVASFNGTSSQATAASATPTSFSNTQPFSACVWFNATSVPGSGDAILLKNLVTSGAANPGFQIDLTSAAEISVFLINNVGTGNYINTTTVGTISSGSLHQVCVTYSGSSTAAGVSIYIDGAAQSNVVGTDALAGSSVSTQPVLIGWDGSDTTQTFNGVMGRVRIWNVEKSAPQIAAYYAAGAQ